MPTHAPPSPDNPSFRFAHLLEVVESDIDALNHANNVVYVRWVQDVAAAHWLAAYLPPERNAYVWVVLEHRVRYLRPAHLGDTLRASTWIGETKGATMQRFTRIERVSDGAILCEAESQWCLLDPHTQRPRRVAQTVTDRLRSPLT